MIVSTIATGPNAILVSPDWRQELVTRKEGAEQRDTKRDAVPWWRDQVPGDALCSACRTTKGEVAILTMEIIGETCGALLDSGAFLSFINPAVVEQLGLKLLF